MPRISSPWGNIFCKFGKEAAVCLDKTIIYTRDAGGNVTQKKVYALSTQENPEGHPERTMVYVFFVKHFSLKKASEFPVFSEGFFLL